MGVESKGENPEYYNSFHSSSNITSNVDWLANTYFSGFAYSFLLLDWSLGQCNALLLYWSLGQCNKSAYKSTTIMESYKSTTIME